MLDFVKEIKVKYKLPLILSLGSESSGNFSILQKGKIYLSSNFDDLLNETNYKKYLQSLLSVFKKYNFRPEIILTDLHPNYKTSILGNRLAQKYKAKLIRIQHHRAHIFSAFGEHNLGKEKTPNNFIGIACDGTGFGDDGNIWGGEVFSVLGQNNIARAGGLEQQDLIGGDLAILEPARMLLAILSKIYFEPSEIYPYLKKFYTQNQFNLLFSQLNQNFNCQKTSGTARVLDAASVLLGFSQNKRKSKHQPTYLLEKNSTQAYLNLKPVIKNIEKSGKAFCELQTTSLFVYLLKNLDKDKQKLGATVQKYLVQGLIEIAGRVNLRKVPVYAAGGMASNKIFREFFLKNNVQINKKIPSGDAGISFGQIACYLLTNSRN